MTSIVDVASYVPRQIPLAERANDLGINDKELRRYSRAYGYEQVCYDPSESESDLLVRAAAGLTALSGREQDVRYVLRSRTVRSPSPYPHSPLREATSRLGLEHAETFAITEQLCAGGLLSVDLAGELLATDDDPDALALILLGEKTFGTVGQLIPGMALLGEATAAFLVSAGTSHDVLAGYSATTVEVPGSGMTMGPDAVTAFGEVYADSLDAVVHGALDAAGVSSSDLALYLPHNTNKILCVRTSDRLGIDRDRILLDNIPRTAHCWGADPFINLRTALDQDRLAPGDHYLMTSVGLGATFAAAVLRH